jgi:beta-N-acetylglucosaminidase
MSFTDLNYDSELDDDQRSQIDAKKSVSQKQANVTLETLHVTKPTVVSKYEEDNLKNKMSFTDLDYDSELDDDQKSPINAKNTLLQKQTNVTIDSLHVTKPTTVSNNKMNFTDLDYDSELDEDQRSQIDAKKTISQKQADVTLDSLHITKSTVSNYKMNFTDLDYDSELDDDQGIEINAKSPVLQKQINVTLDSLHVTKPTVSNDAMNFTDLDYDSELDEDQRIEINARSPVSQKRIDVTLDSLHVTKPTASKYEKDDLKSRLDFSKTSTYIPWGQKVLLAIEVTGPYRVNFFSYLN